MKEDQFKGEIYILICLKTGKSYIGQALCYVSNRVKWGTNERWKSHLREAFGSSKDHCVLLNNALRKYGEENFFVDTLIKCNINELNFWEKEYIKIFDTMVPNGYNLNEGGSKGKDSAETKEKKRLMRIGKTHSENTKLRISLGQLGNRRNTTDNLPMFMCKLNIHGNLIGYSIRYPIIENNKFSIIKHKIVSSGKRSVEDCFKIAKQKIDDLDKQHNMKEKINKINEEIKNKQMRNKKELPEFIRPIIVNKRKLGYSVEGFKDINRNEYPRKEFNTRKENYANLRNAKKYLEELKMKNKNDAFIIPELPKYLVLYNEKSRTGKLINGFRIHKYPVTKNGETFMVSKKFTNMSISMEEKYNSAINYYKQLEKGEC
ncbi:MAG: hypothetical protein GTN36_05695 [Candidatus Aenigmarchaeota archaeon]|nr:hypothetical protein [Candidatus Aenigmarchaeota archaeon]